ncbi:SEC10/PgrA surface exclusion domain-containing protein [Ligilactobacillus sp. LYQ112]|uniref:SEC10/PgrA surface exclusion domain-containing protein n=1 Tax=Ligilactobacillus sp. LYQ112 TaxID=3391060 RepID=UPI00398340BF
MEKKKVLTAVAVGAATMAAGVGANHVKADSVTVTKQQVGDETKVTTTTTKTVDSQEQINQTKQQVAAQKKTTDQASSVVDQDSQKVNQDKSDVAHWQSEASQATPANIAANQQAQSSQQAKISADKTTVSNQQKNVSDAQNKVDSAQSNLNDKQAAQSSAQTAYNNAENDYNKAKDEVANSQQAIANQQNQVNQDKQTVANDQSKVTDLTNQVSSDQNQVTADENNINNAGQKAQADQDKLNQDESSLSTAQNQLNSDQQKLNDLQNQSQNLPIADTIPSWDKKYMSNSNSTSADQTFTDDEVNSDMQTDAQMRTYLLNHNNPALNYYVDAGNLSDNDLKVLNEQIIAYLNQYRKQLGLTPLDYNSEATQIANALAKTVDKDNAYGTDDPNEFNVLNNYHLSSPSFGTMGLDSTSSNENHITMNDLVNQCLLQVRETLYNDTQNDLGHMHELLDSGNVLLGFAPDEKGEVHYVNINLTLNGSSTYENTNIPQDPSIFDGKSEAVPDASDVQSQIASAKQAVQNDQSQVNSLTNQVNADKAQLAQDTPSGLQQQLANDQAKLSQDTQALNNAKQTLTNDQQTLQNDENTLSQMQQNASDPQAYLSTMENQLATAKTNLDNANNDVAQAQQAYNDAENNLKQQQQILANDQAQLAKDEATLKDLQQQAQDYADAPQKLADVQQKLTQDMAQYNQDHQTYLDDLRVLNELETKLLNEEKTYTTITVEWIRNPHPTTTSEIGNQYVLNNRLNQSSNGQQSATSATVQFDSMDEVQAAEVPGLRRSNRNNGLPDTGDNQNSAATIAGLLGLGLAGILSMFGLAERKKRGEN